MEKKQEEEKDYLSPHLEIVNVDVEEGFATSIKGSANDFTTNDFGDRGGTMTNY